MDENLAGEKILITGGTGFLGSYVLDELIARGASPVVVTRRASKELREKYGAKISLCEIDLLDDKAVEKLFECLEPAKIIHLAGATGKRNGETDDLETINFRATAKILDLAVAARIKKIVLTGTADEYGFAATPQVETMAAAPISAYAVSKNRAVEYALSLYDKHRLPIVILRPFTVYGIGQPSRMFLSQAVECAVGNRPFAMSEGIQKRDLVFVTDLADAMIKALMSKSGDGEIFNVGSGANIALRELADKIWTLTGADRRLLKVGARRTTTDETHDTLADISKIESVYGWHPKIALEEGLKIIIERRRQLI